mmetsp:Transcript_4651/g.12463  ORF Transcript_4651/g.12463 Transcript_4651/m.12463 type:complete len:297 (-) Transcript_4651:1457-2347(-)
MPSMIPSFCSCRSRIFSSIDPRTTSLTTSTGRCCPIRWHLSAACASTAGDHQGSEKITLFPFVRFSPAPAALRLQSATLACPAWKAATRAWRSAGPAAPSMSTLPTPAVFSRSSSRRSICLNCEKTTTESPSQHAISSSTASTLASTPGAAGAAGSSAQGTTSTGARLHSGQLLCRGSHARMHSPWKAWPHLVITGSPSDTCDRQMAQWWSAWEASSRSSAWRSATPGPPLAAAKKPDRSGVSFCSSASSPAGSSVGEQHSCRSRSSSTSTSAERWPTSSRLMPPTCLAAKPQRLS